MRKAATICGAIVALLATNWASMNAGYEYGADTSSCVAFDLLTDIPAAEIPMCERAAATALYGPRIAWLWITGDSLSIEIGDEQ